MSVNSPYLAGYKGYPEDDLTVAAAKIVPWDPAEVTNPYDIELVLSRLPTPDETHLLSQATIIGSTDCLRFADDYAYLKVSQSIERVEAEKNDVLATVQWVSTTARQNHQDRLRTRADATRRLARINWR
ncbi:hypothetical protein [Microlunatus speluncae]|uniref:hypothetical protein n=1 Tax=Microlunatus speluncae TaxID=2594267 RepID=UPI0012666BD1|nr:hypothetical protein [Microlunatus speluncae]